MRTLYCMVEESNRELLSRLLIAGFAAERGLRTVIAPQWQLQDSFATLPRGVVLFKGNNAVQVANMRRAKAAGHAVASIEEEIFAVADEDEIAALYHPGIERACDLCFAQGPLQSGVLSSRAQVPRDRIRIVGNPRADLLKLAGKLDGSQVVREIRAEFGAFVLINSNFASINSTVGDLVSFVDLCARIGYVDPAKAHDRNRMWAWTSWEKHNLRALVDFTHAFAQARPDVTVVFRPHPSERFDVWQHALAELPSVRVVRDRDHVSWILASKLLVHTGCTTGLEAFLLGRPAITLVTNDMAWHEAQLGNLVNRRARNVGQAITMAEAILENGDGPANPDALSRLSHHLTLEADGCSAERIVDAVDELLDRSLPHGDSQPVALSSATVASERMRHKVGADPVGMQRDFENFRRHMGLRAACRVTVLGGSGIMIEPTAERAQNASPIRSPMPHARTVA